MELLTKEDLQQLRIDLLNDLKDFITPVVRKEPEAKWTKSGTIRKLLAVSHGTLLTLRIKGLLHPKKINGRYYYNLKEANDLFLVKKKESNYE